MLMPNLSNPEYFDKMLNYKDFVYNNIAAFALHLDYPHVSAP